MLIARRRARALPIAVRAARARRSTSDETRRQLRRRDPHAGRLRRLPLPLAARSRSERATTRAHARWSKRAALIMLAVTAVATGVLSEVLVQGDRADDRRASGIGETLRRHDHRARPRQRRRAPVGGAHRLARATSTSRWASSSTRACRSRSSITAVAVAGGQRASATTSLIVFPPLELARARRGRRSWPAIVDRATARRTGSRGSSCVAIYVARRARVLVPVEPLAEPLDERRSAASRASQSAPTSAIHAADLVERLGRRPVARLATVALGRDEARIGERREVLGDGLTADRQLRGEVARRVGAAAGERAVDARGGSGRRAPRRRRRVGHV